MNISITDKKILDEGIINFFYKKKEYRSLSNFWINDVTIIDLENERIYERIYESEEPYFHEEKFVKIQIEKV